MTLIECTKLTTKSCDACGEDDHEIVRRQAADICIDMAQFSLVEAAQLISSKTNLRLDVQSGKGN